MKNQLLIISAFITIFFSCSKQKKYKITDIQPEISTDNQKAITLYEEAEALRINGKLSSSVDRYISAIEEEPNYILALLKLIDIAPNVADKKELINNFRDSLNIIVKNGTAYEKIVYRIDSLRRYANNDSLSRVLKYKLMDSLVSRFPKSVDAHLFNARIYVNQNNDWWGNEREKKLKSLEKAIELDPSRYESRLNFFRTKYSFGRFGISILRSDPAYFDSFEDEKDNIIKLDPENPVVYRLIGNLYNDSYDFQNKTLIEKSNEFYDKALELFGNSVESNEILLNKSRAYFRLKDNEKGLATLQKKIESSETDLELVESYFNLVSGYIHVGDYLAAINQINDLYGSLQGFGFSEDLILKTKLGLSSYKTLIFAHINQVDRSKAAFEEFETNAVNLRKYFELPETWKPSKMSEEKRIEIEKKVNKIIANAGSEIYTIRWNGFNMWNFLWDRVWINILNGDFDLADQFQDDFEETFGCCRQEHWDGMLAVMRGESKKGEEMMDNAGYSGFPYIQFIRAQAKMDLGKMEEAKSLLDSVKQSRPLDFFNDFIIKKAETLSNSL